MMTNRCHATLLCGTLFATLPGVAGAQAPVELGIDVAMGVTDHRPGPTEWFAAIPQRRLRVGIPASTRLTIEPAVASSVTHFDNISSWDLRLGLDALYSLSGRRGPNAYVGAGITGVYQWGRTAGVSRQAGQLWLGGSAGVKLPLARQLAFRAELRYDHGFGNTSLGGFNQLILRLGPSLLTR